MFLTIIVAIFGVVALVVIHEFGHFFVAKKCGVKVEEFGVGLPPRIWGKRFGQTLYSLNLLPFGAFVKIYGEEGGIEDYRSFGGKPMWQRMFIVLGGVISFWIVAALIFTLVAGMWGLPTVKAEEVVWEPYTWHQAPIEGLVLTGQLTKNIVQGWIMGLKDALGIEELPKGVKMEVMGPLGIFDLLRKYLAEGINYFLYLIGVIAIALALVNILPIPALDGGKMLFLGIEAVRKKPVPVKIEQNITAFFFILLIILIIYITIKFDIPRLF